MFTCYMYMHMSHCLVMFSWSVCPGIAFPAALSISLCVCVYMNACVCVCVCPCDECMACG